MPGTLLDQNVYFAPGLLDDENETYLRTILLCHPAAPKIAYAFQPTPFRNFACAVAYWATAGLGSRSSASHSLKGYEGSLVGFTKREYGATDVSWDL